MHWTEAKGIKSESYHSYEEGDQPRTPPGKSSGDATSHLSVYVRHKVFGTYSQCLCWAHIHRMFLCHNI